MKKMSFEETTMLDASANLRELADGYLVCSPRIARTGIQVYRGAEVGRPDLAQVRVYRPESEVMHRDAVKSLAGRPVTIEHPDVPVTSRNWSDFAVGHLGDEILRDGEFLRVPLHLMDAEAIGIVRDGKRQLSVGYTAVLQWGDGKTDGGEDYNAIQTSIRANHVAITHTARGGDKLRMGDHRKKEARMAKLTVDGIDVEMEDRDAQLVERHINNLAKAAATATALQTDIAAVKTELANTTAVVAAKDAEVATLKQQLADALSPEKRAEAARARNAVEQRARALVDSIKITDAMTDVEIRRQVVNSICGDTAKPWDDNQVSAVFASLDATIARGTGTGTLQHVRQVMQNNDTGGVDPVAKAYAEYDTALTERWKTAGVRAQ